MLTYFKSKSFWFCVLLLGHLFGVLFYFGAIDIMNSAPIYNYDYPFHLYDGWEYKPMIRGGHSWGYDPFFMAGFIQGASLDNEFISLIDAFLPLQGQIYLIKIWVIFILLSLPLFIFLSSRNFGLDEQTSFASAVVLLVYLYNNYFINDVIQYGMYNFIFGSIFSLFNLSLCYDYFSHAKTRTFFLLCITLPVLLLVHSSTWLVFFIPWIVLYVACFKKCHIRQHIATLGLTVGTALAIFFWIILPFKLHVWPYMTELNLAKQLFQVSKIKQIVQELLYKPTSTHAQVNIIHTIILILGAVGLKKLTGFKPLRIMLAVSSALFFIFTFFHSWVLPSLLTVLEPYKYVIPLVFFLTIPAGKTLRESLNFAQILRRRFLVKFTYGITLFILLGSSIYIHAFANPQRGLFTTPPKDVAEIEKWVTQRPIRKGRFMIESDLPTRSLFDKPSSAYGMIVIKTKGQFLGWTHRTCVFSNNFASITKDRIFGKPWASIQEKQLSDYFELYNVGWIIARSGETKGHLAKINKNGNLFIRLQQIGFIKEKQYRFSLYKVKRDLNFMYGGTADVKVGINHISIRNLKTQEKDIILKYHWHPTLKATHGLTLEPVYLMDAPVPFIKVKNVNTPEFDIYNSYTR